MLAAGTLILALVSPASGWGWGDSCVSCIPLLRMEKQLPGRCPSPLWCFPLVLKEDCFQRPPLLLCSVFLPLQMKIIAFAFSIAVGGRLSVTYSLQSDWLHPPVYRDFPLSFPSGVPSSVNSVSNHPPFLNPACPIGVLSDAAQLSSLHTWIWAGAPRPQVFGWWQQ